MGVAWWSAAFVGVLFLLYVLTRVNRTVSTAVALDRAFSREADRLDRTIRDELARVRSEVGAGLVALLEHRLTSLDRALELRLASVREEVSRQTTSMAASLDRTAEATASRVEKVVVGNDSAFTVFAQQLGQFETKLDLRFETLRSAVDSRLGQIQEDNAARLGEMRATVEEKLQSTLERRVGESFALVSQQLEQVHRALGEMQSLSENVGDLRRVMANVRARGALGEWRLDALLQELLTSDQYGRNVQPVPGSAATVEFAVRMPRNADVGANVWLPVDSKFPVEAYERVVASQNAGDRDALDNARRELAAAIRNAARNIHEKYVAPPHTTEYAVLFLPTESLFAEVVRLPGINEEVHRDYRVMVAGPTTLATLLNALQMGFRTVALTQRANEVWTVLGAVRTEFAKFGQAMTLVKKKLEQATSAVEKVEVRRRAMGRKLKAVEELPSERSEQMLALSSSSDAFREDEQHDLGAAPLISDIAVPIAMGSEHALVAGGES